MQGLIRRNAVLDLALESLSLAGELRLRVTGTSMMPGILSGSHVRIRSAGLSEPRPGQIVLVRAAPGLRLHRFVGRDKLGGLITRGDNHSWDDPPVGARSVLGVLVKVEEVPSLRARLLGLMRSWARHSVDRHD